MRRTLLFNSMPPLERYRDARTGEKFLHRDLRLPDERSRFGESRRRARWAAAIARCRARRGRRLVFYNTCSIREKAAQKVFSRLGLFDRGILRATTRSSACSAVWRSRKANDIFERAPWVSLVCGSASYRKLPLNCWRSWRPASGRVTGLDTDTDETFETELTRRDNPFRAYITIIEGCDKACSYCVVPYTRGPERSRASACRSRGSRANWRMSATPKSNCSARRSIPTAIHRPRA